MHAVYFNQIGNGKVLLCGPHIEVDALFCSTLLPPEEIKDFEINRQMFVKYLLSKFD